MKVLNILTLIFILKISFIESLDIGEDYAEEGYIQK